MDVCNKKAHNRHSQVIDRVDRDQSRVGSLVDRGARGRLGRVGCAHGTSGGDLRVGLGLSDHVHIGSQGVPEDGQWQGVSNGRTYNAREDSCGDGEFGEHRECRR